MSLPVISPYFLGRILVGAVVTIGKNADGTSNLRHLAQAEERHLDVRIGDLLTVTINEVIYAIGRTFVA